MTLGEKLRQVRVERGLSQAQVAGTQITRNMLSQIEHDQASPSVKTLLYLAETLDISAGWLLEEDGSGRLDEQARLLFQKRDYASSLELLLSQQRLSEEARLILFRSALRYGRQLLDDGKIEEAEKTMKAVLLIDGSYISDWDGLKARGILCECAMRQGHDSAEAFAQYLALYESCGIEREKRLLAAQYHLAARRPEDAENELRACGQEDTKVRILCGAAAVQKGNYEAALEILRGLETETRMTNAERESMYSLLERCYKELEDYKMAYHYASLRLHEK